MNKLKVIVMLLVAIFVMSVVPAYTDVVLEVPFLQQFWNDGTCGHGSCGPASLSMCCRYVHGISNSNGTPTPQDMIDVWSYLGGDTSGNDMNGTSLSQLTSAAHGVFHVDYAYQTTSTLASVKSEIAAGRPVLVHVYAGYLSNRGYSYTGGHYIAAVGYGDNYLICNDPGTYLGEHKYYSDYDMINAMNAVGCGVIKGFYNPPQPPPARPSPGVDTFIQYTSHVQNVGWQSWVEGGALTGTVGQLKRMEAICIYSPRTNIYYSTHVSGVGWQNWVGDGEVAGTTGLAQQIEAIQIAPGDGYKVYYQAQVQDYSWLPVVCDGATAGTTGMGKRLEALKIWLVDLNNLPGDAPNPGTGTHVQYSAHVPYVGWQDWVKDGETAGTTGQSKAIQAICISSPNTDIHYSVHIGDGFDWQPWVSNGTMAGTTGINKQMEAIAITCGAGYSVSYQAHVQDIGWMPVVSNGTVAGTTGQGKRLEALRVWVTPN
ncbi:C39 family peptidase [bacterium]|nr:C39 family peptidase [bacterium]